MPIKNSVSSDGSGYSVDDKRIRPFTIIDNEIVKPDGTYLPRLIKNKLALPILCVMYSKNNNTNYIPSITSLAKNLKTNRRLVQRAFVLLEDLKLIQVIHRKGFKSKIILLPLSEPQQQERKITEDDVVGYIMKKYNGLTPRTKDLLFAYLTNDTEQFPQVAALFKVKDEIEKAKAKIRLAN